MLSSVSSWFWAKQYDFCQREFPQANLLFHVPRLLGCISHSRQPELALQVYEGFIDHLMDTLLGQGPTAPYRGSQVAVPL